MVKKIVSILVLIFAMISSVSAYNMYFIDNNGDRVDQLNVFSDSNVFNLKLKIDNSNSADYISPESQLSYLKVNPAGKNENYLMLKNRELRKNGVFIDKDVIEKIDIEFRLPLTQKWDKEYNLQVVGITPDDRQKIASIKVIPKGKQAEALTSNINQNYLIWGISGLIVILLLIFLFDHFKLWKVIFGGGKNKW